MRRPAALLVDDSSTVSMSHHLRNHGAQPSMDSYPGDMFIGQLQVCIDPAGHNPRVTTTCSPLPELKHFLRAPLGAWEAALEPDLAVCKPSNQSGTCTRDHLEHISNTRAQFKHTHGHLELLYIQFQYEMHTAGMRSNPRCSLISPELWPHCVHPVLWADINQHVAIWTGVASHGRANPAATGNGAGSAPTQCFWVDSGLFDKPCESHTPGEVA